MILYSIVRNDGVIMLSGFREKKKAEETLLRLCHLTYWTSDPDWTYRIEEKDVGLTNDFTVYTDDSETVFHSDIHGNITKKAAWRVISDTQVEYRAFHVDNAISYCHVIDYPDGNAQAQFIENARMHRERGDKNAANEGEKAYRIKHVEMLCKSVAGWIAGHGYSGNIKRTLLHYIFCNRNAPNAAALIALFESHFGPFSMPEMDPYRMIC